MKWPTASLIALGSFLLFVVSCFMPALLAKGNPPFDGWVLVLLGWTAVFASNFGWLANICYVLSLLFVMLKWRLAARIGAALGFAVAFDSLQMVGKYVPMDEGDVNKAFIIGMGSGFYVWMGALGLLFVASLLVVPKLKAPPVV